MSKMPLRSRSGAWLARENDALYVIHTCFNIAIFFEVSSVLGSPKLPILNFMFNSSVRFLGVPDKPAAQETTHPKKE